MSKDPKDQPLKTVMQFCGEFLLPGGSNLVQGNWKRGSIYAVAGFVARAALGVPGLLAVSSDSIAVALTGQHIHQLLGRQTPTGAGVSFVPQPALPTPAVADDSMIPRGSAPEQENAAGRANTPAAKRRRPSTIKKTKRA